MSYGPREASCQELALVQYTHAFVDRTDARFSSLYGPASVHPIPFFGSLASARILTFGLNPSADEFSPARSWPARLSDEALTARLVGYFGNHRPGPHPWFRPWSRALDLIGASYPIDAAHIDLSPRATRSARTFVQDPQRSKFLEMLRIDAPSWIGAIDAAPNLKLIMMAGVATNQYYITKFINTQLPDSGVSLLPPWKPGSGTGQTALQELKLPSGRRIEVFFCTSGPHNPEVLVDAVRDNAERLRRIAEA